MNETISRSVAQIQNPVQPPETVSWGCKLNRIVKNRFVDFCTKNGWTQGDVADAALSDYMDGYERLQNVRDVVVVADPEVEEEEFDPFAGSVPE